MTIDRDRMIQIVRDVVSAKEAIDTQFSAMDALVGSDHSSPLWKSIFGGVDVMIVLAAEMIGDHGGFLNWYIWDNQCGHGRLQIMNDATGQVVQVCCHEDLVDLVISSHRVVKVREA